MRYERGYRSSDVEDRRGSGPAGGGPGVGGLLGLLYWLFRVFGIWGVLIGLVVFGGWWYCSASGGQPLTGGGGAESEQVDDEMKSFISFVFDDAQRAWVDLYTADGKTYDKATMVLFTGRVDSACGLASSAVGPFYCPGDNKVYIDLSFYRALKEKLGAPGDFAQAYVIAHEVGHHVQNLRGVLGKKQSKGAEGTSVRVELQADCYAGVWAYSTKRRDLLEAGDLEEAMRAAEAIGDDALQEAATGTVQPEKFSHGSSEQRMRWFKRGFESGDPKQCDTFSAASL